MSLRSVPPQSPLVPPPNDSVPSTSTTSTNNTGTPNTTPVVQQKVQKGEFKRLTNEWNETHEKLTENFRQLNVIFADIKFLLQQLESQLKAAGITSDLSHCVEAVESCVESFSNANANAASLDMHIKQLNKNDFENASPEIKEIFKKLTDKVAEAGNLGNAIGIPGAAQNASGTQPTPPTAPTAAVTQPVPPAASTAAVTQPTPTAAPAGTFTQPTQPVKSFIATMQSGRDLLEQIDGKLEEIGAASNSLNKKINSLKADSLKLKQERIRLEAKLKEVYNAWDDVKKLFDEQKAEKEKATRSGIPFTQEEQVKYDLNFKNIQQSTLVSLKSIVDINKDLEKIDRKYQKLSGKLNELKNRKDEINNQIKSTSIMKADARKHLADSGMKINETILVRKNRKYSADKLSEGIQERGDNIKIQRSGFKIIEDNLENMNNHFSEINNEISNLKLAAKKMQQEIHPYSFPLIT